MDLIDRSQSRGKTPWDPLVQDTATMFGTRAVDPILAAVMCDRIIRPDIWPQSLRSEISSASCQQGAVHIWVSAPISTASCRHLKPILKGSWPKGKPVRSG